MDIPPPGNVTTIQHVRSTFKELVDCAQLLTDLECAGPVRLRDLQQDITSFRSQVEPVRCLFGGCNNTHALNSLPCLVCRIV